VEVCDPSREISPPPPPLHPFLLDAFAARCQIAKPHKLMFHMCFHAALAHFEMHLDFTLCD